MDLSSFEALLSTLKTNRFETEFTDKEKIGRGGFASVYKATNILDGQTYAVKKVQLAVKDIQNNFNRELQKVLAEAKFLASINHHNILRYCNSWLEATTKKRKPQLEPICTSFKPKFEAEYSEDSPFAMKGIDESEEDSPCFVFQHSQKENHKQKSNKYRGFNRPKVEPKKSRFYAKAHGLFEDQQPLSEDHHDVSESEDNSPLRLPKNQNKLNMPRIGDEILESVTLYIQTELCTQTLEDYLHKRNQHLEFLKKTSQQKYQLEKKNCFKEAISFAKQIRDGIAHIHSRQIVHRDLKPGNIFLVGKTIKIGDFGLVKRLNSFCPIQSSPSLSVMQEKDNTSDSFKLETTHSDSTDQMPELFFQKTTSDPVYQYAENDVLYLEIESPITKSVGTRTFASPEQLQADKGNFDHRADIFSLGIVYLLLFHPMLTSMEQHHAIKDCKHGKVPQDLQKDLPDIANMIVKMLSNKPCDRPTIEEITTYLNLPIQEYSDLAGSLCVKRENSGTWRNKFFKLVDKNLYIFTKETDKKAEQVYDLSQWRVLYREESPERDQVGAEENGDASTESSPLDISCIAIENPLQLGCTFKAESPNQTLDIYQKFTHFGESF